MVDPSSADNFAVSVVIPTYNRIKQLPIALDSVLSQTRPVTEILVVDDGSTDNTIENLSPKYKTITFLRQKNKGVSSARNAGIKAAKSPWIALLDSDDQWMPDKIEKQIHCLSENNEIKACHTGEKWIRKGKEVQTARFLNKAPEGLFERSLERCIICPSSVILHHSIFEKIGYFDTELPICEDYDFWLRLLPNHQIGLVDEPLVVKTGGHPDQLSTSTWGLDRFHVQSLEKIYLSEELNSRQKEMVLKTLAHKADLLAKGFIKYGKEGEARKYNDMRRLALENLGLLTSVPAS